MIRKFDTIFHNKERVLAAINEIRLYLKFGRYTSSKNDGYSGGSSSDCAARPGSDFNLCRRLC